MNNFHTHTYLCKHASGTPIDYVKMAEKSNCTALGFSDHCPYPDNTWPQVRMKHTEINLYKKQVNEAKEVANFPVYFGFECEWLPRFKSWFSDVLIGEHGAEYLILGSHWVPIDNHLTYIFNVKKKTDLKNYIDLTIQGMETGLYKFLAHPDLFLGCVSNIDSYYLDLSKELISAAVSLNIPLEINGNGANRKKITRDGKLEYPYPVEAFWELAGKSDATIIMSSDAHKPETVIKDMNNAKEFADRLGLKIQNTAEVLGFDEKIIE
ncbi:MAG: histidinol phosphate phosphatase [Treponema sp.]|nr:MAG: histidinol phosphate phosphatase [Treponema sp.]